MGGTRTGTDFDCSRLTTKITTKVTASLGALSLAGLGAFGAFGACILVQKLRVTLAD